MQILIVTYRIILKRFVDFFCKLRKTTRSRLSDKIRHVSIPQCACVDDDNQNFRSCKWVWLYVVIWLFDFSDFETFGITSDWVYRDLGGNSWCCCGRWVRRHLRHRPTTVDRTTRLVHILPDEIVVLRRTTRRSSVTSASTRRGTRLSACVVISFGMYCATFFLFSITIRSFLCFWVLTLKWFQLLICNVQKCTILWHSYLAEHQPVWELGVEKV